MTDRILTGIAVLACLAATAYPSIAERPDPQEETPASAVVAQLD